MRKLLCVVLACLVLCGCSRLKPNEQSTESLDNNEMAGFYYNNSFVPFPVDMNVFTEDGWAFRCPELDGSFSLINEEKYNNVLVYVSDPDYHNTGLWDLEGTATTVEFNWDMSGESIPEFNINGVGFRSSRKDIESALGTAYASTTQEIDGVVCDVLYIVSHINDYTAMNYKVILYDDVMKSINMNVTIIDVKGQG